jgi:UDP-N-acetylmuramate dehydrogenase
METMNFSDLTTLKIGGPVREFVSAETEEQLINSIQLSAAKDQPYLVIGGGSNLLVSDDGFDGTVIKNEIKGTEKDGDNLIVKSGTVLQDLVDFANKEGLSGLENLAGIPGTVGGAIYGNAGAYGQTISDHLTSVKVFDPNNETMKQFNNEECQFNYRYSIFKKNKAIILEATFTLSPADPETLKKTSEETIKKREVKYPPEIKCPGSFFKNIPANTLPTEILNKLPKEFILYGKVSAGALLEGVGAKGTKQGSILIALYHANLFINEGNGTAKDFYNLAKIYCQKVFEKYGIKLEPEVQLINLPRLS